MNRDWLTLAFGLALVGIVLALSLRQNLARRGEDPAPEPAPAAAAESAAVDPPPAPAVPAERPAGAPATAGRKPRTAAPPAEPERVAAAGAHRETNVALHVQSDVPGASVFLDREFVGTTPLTLRGLTTGERQLNVTATGHDGYAAPIVLAEGANRVSVEFLKVRLNASVPVVHRHAMGSCQGMLAATPKGLTFDTAHAPDKFTLAFADLDEFEVDYLKKNLRVRRRAGKTWNFTNDNPDALFVFHRDVSRARERLAQAR